MAFAKSSDFTINHSNFVDKSITNNITTSKSKIRSGDGWQGFLDAISMDASFNSQARFPPPHCDENTRIALLEHIFQWIDSGREDILFLGGPAGAGKSAVAQTVAGICAEKKILAGSYFFFRGSPFQNTIVPLIPTITYHMISSTARMRKKVEYVVKGDPLILDKSSEEQACKLILEPHRRSLPTRIFWPTRKRHIVVIDGLDECNGDEDQRRVIRLIGQLVNKKRAIVRCLIASRPEPQILSAMNSLPTNITVARVTLNEDSWDAEGDIRTYLRSHFDKTLTRLPSSTPHPWPSDEVLEVLVEKAGGIFIYASTVVKYVNDEDALPTEQLEHVLKLSPGTAPFAEIDMLYHQILKGCPPHHRTTLLHIFGFIFLRNPDLEELYDISLIEALLNLSPGEVSIVLRRMHSILAITTTGSNTTIDFLHASFGDFVFNEERSGEFFIDHERESHFLASMCIDYMCCEGKKLNRIPINDKAMRYSWNSWFHHGKHANEPYFLDLVTKLCCCDKSLWVKSLPKDHYQFCKDGLAAGAIWLKHHITKKRVHPIPPDLHIMVKELSRTLFKIMLGDPPHITVLSVFEDPGIDFFKLDDYVVILEQLNRSPTLLYLRNKGSTHDLMWLDTGSVSEYLAIPCNLWDKRLQAVVAAACLSQLVTPQTPQLHMNLGLRYAVKYWAKHISLSSDSILENLELLELRKVDPERQVTVADVSMVVEWLEGNPTVAEWEHKLLSVWKGYCQELELNPNLGFHYRSSRRNRRF